VHRDGVDAVMAETLDEPVGAALGPHEDEREVALGPELVDERLEAEGMLDLEEAVLDLRSGIGRLVGVLALTGSRVKAAAARPPGRRGWPRRTASGAVSGHWRRSARPRAEAHVEHPVGLVEHEHPRRGRG
jgi:hypothetical protein